MKRAGWIVAATSVALVGAACSGGGGNHVAVGANAPSTTGAPDAADAGRLSTTNAPTATTKPSKAKPASTTTIVNGVVVTVPPTSHSTDGTNPGTNPVTTPSPPTTVEHPVPYDPSKPINLCCVPGVTPQEQARAEQLVRATLQSLPHWANPNTAVAEGYRSIGDAATGDEHFVKWSLLDDGHVLDPQRPESLVYEMRSGHKTLVAAMYMLWTGSTFANVPDIGGPLTQWHVHNDLCLAQNKSDPLQWLLSGQVDQNGHCPAGTEKKGNEPMIHVWIIANPCGPFAGLKGEGGGQIPAGEKPLCDKAHG